MTVAQRSASVLPDELTCRAFALNVQTFDESTRSVEAVIATEQPTLVMDWSSGRMIEEVLLMRGARLPANGQVPLLDNHSRQTVSHVMGSCRNLRIDRSELIGRNYFARRAAADEALSLVREGHLTDNSAGYRVMAFETIPAGKTRTVLDRSFTASPHRPLRVVTDWQLCENSLCAIGADTQAKVRSDAAPDQCKPCFKEYRSMSFEKWLHERGLKLDELNETQAAALREDFDQCSRSAEPPAAAAPAPVDESALLERGRRAELDRQAQIRALAGEVVPDQLIQRAIDDNWAVEVVKDKFLEAMRSGMRQSSSHGVALHVRDHDTQSRHLEAALMLRAGGLEDQALKTYGEPVVEAADRIRDMSLVDVAREAIRLSGGTIPTGRDEMIRTAFSTASLPQILGNVANKSMLAGYTALASTWERWCQIGSVQDFKEVTRVRLTDVGELEEVRNGGEVAHGSAVEEYEKFAIATYAKQFAITRTNIINDDLSTFTQVPRKLGTKAAMKVQQLVYAHFLNPGNMADGVALFHSDHSNLNTSNALTQDGLEAAIKAFYLQEDADGQPISVIPKYLMVPPSLWRTARELLESDLLITGADGTIPNKNIYKGVLQPIIEPRLENSDYTGSSATTWYVIADPNTIDTVEVAFLNGRRTPTVERFGATPDTMGVIYRVFIDVGAKALDFRGLQKNTA